MLVVSRKDAECVLFSDGRKTVRIEIKADDNLRLYRGKKLILKLEIPQEYGIVPILGYNVTVYLVRYRAYDDVTIGFVADRELSIFREEFVA